MGLLQHSSQVLLPSLCRVDLVEKQGVWCVGLDTVKRAQNQTFHLQLIYFIQLWFNTWRQIEVQGQRWNVGDRQSCCVNSNKFRRLGREGRRLERHLECLRDSWGKNAALSAKYWLKAGACERLPSHHLLSMLSLSTRRSIVCVWPDIPHTQ